LTDLTWLIAILHGVLFHTDFDQYQLRMKNTRRHDTVHIPRLRSPAAAFQLV